MGKPVERQNHSLSFFILASLIAICTAWAFYEEFLGRRPWKDLQQQTSANEREKAELELRLLEQKVEAGELKVAVDPKKPDETISLKEAREKLAAVEKALAQDRDAVGKLRAKVKEAEVAASDADLNVKMLRSEDDGLFYEEQHAEHQQALALAHAAKERAAGQEKAAASAEAEAAKHGKHKDEAIAKRKKKHEQINAAEEEVVKATAALEAARAELAGKEGERDALKKAIEAALDPIETQKLTLKKITSKWPELTQYWLTSYDNSVDRCQNCHAAIDKCGYSRPHEVLAALEKPNAEADQVAAAFCLHPTTLESYKATAEAVCALEWDEAASVKGEIDPKGGRCLTDRSNRKQIAEFIFNHCGRGVQGLKILEDEKLKGACLSSSSWQVLASYVEEPKSKLAADGSAWSACHLSLEVPGDKPPAGTACVEGAQKEQLVTYLRRHCGATSAALKGLAQPGKVCAIGEAGKKLDQVKPVMFNLPVWAQTHPHRSDLLGSNHPPDRFGCTSCHEGQGAQTKGVAGQPFTHGWDDHYWERPMLNLVTHKRFRPDTFKAPESNSNDGVPGQWVTKQNHFVEATCAKCHADAVNLTYAPTYSEGRKLVAEIGCHGCHPVDTFATFPKLGPTLTDLQQKTTPDFLVQWVSYPRSFRPRTKMPNFWPEALDASKKDAHGVFQVREGSPEAKKRDEEVQAIVAYLWKQSLPPHLPEPSAKGDAERGRVLAHSVGCKGCHNFVPAEKLCTPEQIAEGKSRGTPQELGECEVPRHLSGSEARDFAPNLANIGHKTNAKWLFAWLKNPSALWHQTRMPNLRLSDQEAADITAYLLTLRHGDAPAAQPALAALSGEALEKVAAHGSKLVTQYGCSGCHEIKGHENDAKIGADLNEYGRKTVDLLDFGNAMPNPRHHSWYNFVDLKLRAPRIYRYERVDTKMPQFDLTDDEVKAIMVFLKSRTTDKVPHSYQLASNPRRVSMAHGEQTIEYYNCKGCHVIDGDGGRIRDTYLEDNLANAPPILQQQGWRTQPDWLFNFLRDPSQKLRPWLDVRMPTFPLSDDANTSIVHGFAAHSNVPYPYITVKAEPPSGKDLEEVKAMVAELRCFACHTQGEPAPGQDRSSLAPNLQLARARLRPDWVAAWLTNPQALQEGTKMPSFFSGDDMSAVMYPKYFGGSQQKQIEMLRDYVMSLSGSPPSQQAKR